jgi:hypothetical protein
MSWLAATAPGRSPAATPSRAEQIQQMLDRRSDAVARHDKNGFMATVDPQAIDFRTRQSDWFDRFAALQISGYKLKLNLDDAPELTRKRDAAAYKAPVMVAAVEERYHLGDFDEKPALDMLFLTFVQRAGGWVVASDTGVEDLGLLSARLPWDFGPVQLTSSDHFVLFAHPDQADFAKDLLPLAEASLPEVARVWSRPWHQRVPIFLPSTAAELDRMLGETVDVSNFVAFASYEVDRAASFEVVGHRIYLNRPNFSRHNDQSRRNIFAHELLHVATSEYSGPFVPLWVEEGIAQTAESKGHGSVAGLNNVIKAKRFDNKLPDDLEFISGSSSSIFLSYQEALSAFEYMEGHYGIAKAGDLYQTLGAGRIEPGTARYHMEQALHATLDVSFEQLQSDWASYAAAHAG